MIKKFQNIQRPEILYSEVVEVDCRVIPKLEGKCELGNFANQWRVVEGKTGETFFVTKELDREAVTKSLQQLKSKGIDSISVALAHSYTYFEHEQQIGAIAKELGKTFALNFLGAKHNKFIQDSNMFHSLMTLLL